MWQAGATLHRGARASHHRGLSRCGAQAPDARAQQLCLTGPVTPRHAGSSQTRAQTRVPCIGRQILNHCATREAPIYLVFYVPITISLLNSPRERTDFLSFCSNTGEMCFHLPFPLLGNIPTEALSCFHKKCLLSKYDTGHKAPFLFLLCYIPYFLDSIPCSLFLYSLCCREYPMVP